MQRLHFGLALIWILLLAAACGSSEQLPARSMADQIPFPVDRRPAALSVFIKLGNEDDQRSTNAAEFGTALQLEGLGTGFEYAIYVLSPGNTPNQLDVHINEPSTTEYWVGVGDYTSLSWVMDGPFSTAQSLALGAANLSPLGNVAVAVVTPSTQSVRIDDVQVSAENDPPLADLQASAGGPAPVEITFDASGSQDSDGTIVLYEWDFTNDGSYDTSGAADSTQHTYMLEGNYTCKLRVTDSGGLTATDTAAVTVLPPDDSLPTAVLIADTLAGDVPLAVNFDGSGSSDAEGAIADYEWDFNGNGVYNESGNGEDTSRGNPTPPAYTYTQAGPRSPSLRVTDSGGGTDVASVDIVGRGWKILTLSTDGDEAGRLNYLAVINGKPAIIFHVYDGMEVPPRSIRYAYATTETGSNLADWEFVTTTLTSSGGQQISLCEVADHPAIAWSNSSNKMCYARSATASGATPADWVEVIADSTSFSNGTYNSLAVVNGNPAIAYQGADENTCYVYSSTATGMNSADWSAPVVIDGAMWSSGSWVSLAEIGGNPAIAYGDAESGSRIKYARANNATGTPGTAWSDMGSCKFVLADTSMFPSLRDVNGFPGVAFLNFTGVDLTFASSSTATGAAFADWTLLAIDDGADDTGTLPSLALINGNPAVAHQSQGAEFDLEYLRAIDGNGNELADWPADSIKVDEPGDVGGYCSMVEVNGNAAISYYDNTLFNLKYAVRFE